MLLPAALAGLGGTGCGNPASPGYRQTELVVSAAVNLRDALLDAAEGFERSNPRVRVVLNTAASGVLLQQALRGSPVDVLVSASPTEIERLRAAGRLAAGSRTDIASNAIVVAVPRGARAPGTAGSLRDPVYRRIAIGNPATSPAGRYAEQSLRTLGVWEAIEARLVPAESVRQALSYVVRREVDAALLYRTDALTEPASVHVAVELPSGSHEPVLYQGAVIEGTAHPELARAFLRYLGSADGRHRLAGHGLLPPPEP